MSKQKVKYKQKKKGWLWKLSGTMNRYTTVGSTIYYPKYPARGATLKHELVHVKQFAKHGKFKFLFLYLFALPFLYNPWRWRWEYEAFKKSGVYSKTMIKEILRSDQYGWLRNG